MGLPLCCHYFTYIFTLLPKAKYNSTKYSLIRKTLPGRKTAHVTEHLHYK